MSEQPIVFRSPLPNVVLGALAQLGETVSKLSDELQEMRYLDPDKRLSRVIAHSLREIRTTHEELAQQVGATRENLSHALKRLERRRAIACHRDRIEVLNL